jgi:hypothetical protein
MGETTPAYRFISFAVGGLLSGKRRSQMREVPLPRRSGQEILERLVPIALIVAGIFALRLFSVV